MKLKENIMEWNVLFEKQVKTLSKSFQQNVPEALQEIKMWF